MRVLTHSILMQARIDTREEMAALHASASTFYASAGLALRRATWSQAASLAYLYGELPTPAMLDTPTLSDWTRALSATDADVRELKLSRLEMALDVPGASAGVVPAFHYVVETDPAAGWQDEIFRWYDTEHMPGLAAVPGCIHASRFLRHDHGARSFACYDLATEETLGSPPWLAVRASAWSSTVRPHFTNTSRTMFACESRSKINQREGEEPTPSARSPDS